MYLKGTIGAKTKNGFFFFFLLSREWILNDSRTFDKEGYVGEGVGDGENIILWKMKGVLA